MTQKFSGMNLFYKRFAMLSIDDFKFIQTNEFDEIFTVYFWNNKQIQEAIYLASPLLYYNLMNIQKYKNNESSYLKLKKSFLRYLSRMCTRATPFGTFSGFCDYNPEEQYIDPQKADMVIKKVDVDKSWLLKVYRLIELDNEMKHLHKYIINPNIDYNVDHYVIDGVHILDYKLEKDITSQQYDQLLSKLYIEKENMNLLSYKNLKSNFLLDFGYINENKIFEILINNNLIFSNLRGESIRDLRISKLNEILTTYNYSSHITKKINYLDNSLQEYENTKVGDGIELLEYIKRIMIDIYRMKVKNLVKVDLKIRTPQRVTSDINNLFSVAAEIYPLTCLKQEVKWKKKFVEKFVDEYGKHRHVKLLNLTDPVFGILDNTFFKEEIALYSSYNQEVISFWLNLISKNPNSHSICLDSYNIKRLSLITSNHRNNFSTEIIGEIIHENNVDTLILQDSCYKENAGVTISRFNDYLDDDSVIKIKQFYENEQKAKEEEILVQPNYIAHNASVNNLCAQDIYLDHEVTMGFNNKSNSILLNDLYIGINEDEPYVFSSKLKKRITVKQVDSLAVENLPLPIRALIELTKESGLKNIYNDKLLKNFFFLPRIIFNNVVLMPARWHITLNDLEENKIYNSEELNTWLLNKDIPRYVYIGSKDQKYLLDLRSKFSTEEIYRILKKDKECSLIELVGEIEHRGKTLSGKRGFSEIAFPLEKKCYKPNIKPSIKPLDLKGSQEQILYPGDEWFYLRISMPRVKQDYFLTSHYQEFNYLLMKKEIIEGSYFVRFSKPKDHIRVRFLIKDSENFYRHIAKWIKELKYLDSVLDVSIHTYEREIERYGGEECIGLAEKVFFLQSLLALKVLEIKDVNFKEYFVCFVIKSFMDIFFVKHGTEFTEILTTTKSKKEFRKEFEAKKNIYTKFYFIESERLMEEFKENLLDLMIYADKLNSSEANKHYIFNSLVHMLINRSLTHPTSYEERRIRTYTYYLVRNNLLG